MPRSKTVPDDKVFSITLRLLGKLGFKSLTLEQVGTESRLSPSTLVQRFGSKKKLVLHALVFAVDNLELRAKEICKSQWDRPVDKLVDYLCSTVVEIRKKDDFANHFALLALDVSDKEFQEVANRHNRAQLKLIKHFVDSAAEKKLVVDCDTKALAQSIQIHFNGCLCTWPIMGKGKLTNWVEKNIKTLLKPHTVDGRF